VARCIREPRFKQRERLGGLRKITGLDCWVGSGLIVAHVNTSLIVGARTAWDTSSVGLNQSSSY
jgi:hypothetical protein